MNSFFETLLKKGSCTITQYEQNKILFADAVSAGLISPPEMHEKNSVKVNGSVVSITYEYRWNNIDV